MADLERVSRQRVEQLREDARRFRGQIPDPVAVIEINEEKAARQELQARGDPV